MSTSPESLNVFPPAGEADWRALVDKVLKGAAFEKLVGRTYDGLALQPLYPRAAAEPARHWRAQPGAWTIVTRIDHPGAEAANAQALEDLANGATGLALVFAAASSAHGFGLADARPAALEQLLDGVHLDAGITLEIEAGPDAAAIAATLADLVAARGLDPAQLAIHAGLDPLASAGDVAKLAAGPFATLFAADARSVHAAGGSEAQELAFALGAGLAGLRALEAAGLPLEAARRRITFRMAADADEFMSLAKFRALRRLWARLEEACGLAPLPLRLHAETAWRMTSRRDPYVNMLRATVATFSAALGGADAISVLPFTQALGLPDPFARRLARNTQLVLLHESNLDKVADPAAGAGGFEALTEDLCGAAWALFQAQEKAGGLAALMADGSFAADVARVRAERLRNLARRRDPLTGVSEFPNAAETPVAVLVPRPTEADEGSAATLTPMRLAAPYERLRDAAEARANRPQVFLANLGPVSAFTARATFAKNLFEVAGIAAPGNDGFADAATVAEAFRASGASIACICSSDAVYADFAVAAAQALAAAGARAVYLAGRPGDLEPALRAAGVGDFIFAGMDALAFLERALAGA